MVLLRRFTGLVLIAGLVLGSGVAFARGHGHRGGQGQRGGPQITGHPGVYRGGGGVHHGRAVHGGHRGWVGGSGHRMAPRFSGGRHVWPRYWRGGWRWTAHAPSYAYSSGSYGYYWYYCPQLDAFYPDVAGCPAPWQLVPADAAP